MDIDRFWRNIRTHTLHDPIEYKIRDLGNWALNDQLPEISTLFIKTISLHKVNKC